MQPIKKYNLTSARAQANPSPVWREMQADGAVVPSKMLLINRVWLATTWEASNRVLRNQELFVRDASRVGGKRVPGLKWWIPKKFARLANNMLAHDGEQHRRLRGLVDQAFHRSAVELWQERIETLADGLIDGMMQRQRLAEPVEFVSQFCRELPLNVICELLGLPKEDKPKFKQWFRSFSELKSAWGLFRIIPGVSKLLKYFDVKFEELRNNPQPGLLSDLIQMEVEGDRLTHDELVSTVFLLLVAGHETTVHMLSTGLHAFLTHPEQFARLRNDDSLWPTAIEEFLRFNSPVQMSKPRIVFEDTELCGQTVRRGEYIMAVIGAANADPEKFDEPEKLNLERSPNPHLSFGSGIHTCLGLKLAKAETELGLKRLFERIPDVRLRNSESFQWHGRLGMRCLKQMHLAFP